MRVEEELLPQVTPACIVPFFSCCPAAAVATNSELHRRTAEK